MKRAQETIASLPQVIVAERSSFRRHRLADEQVFEDLHSFAAEGLHVEGSQGTIGSVKSSENLRVPFFLDELLLDSLVSRLNAQSGALIKAPFGNQVHGTVIETSALRSMPS